MLPYIGQKNVTIQPAIYIYIQVPYIRLKPYIGCLIQGFLYSHALYRVLQKIWPIQAVCCRIQDCPIYRNWPYIGALYIDSAYIRQCYIGRDVTQILTILSYIYIYIQPAYIGPISMPYIGKALYINRPIQDFGMPIQTPIYRPDRIRHVCLPYISHGLYRILLGGLYIYIGQVHIGHLPI